MPALPSHPQADLQRLSPTPPTPPASSSFRPRCGRPSWRCPMRYPVPDPSGPPSPGYPASFEISYPSELNRWLPLVKWLLASRTSSRCFLLPSAPSSSLIYAFFAVLFTGRWPRGAFDYLVGTLGWYYRVIAYVHLMTDAYPPFSLADDPTTRCGCTSTTPSTSTTGGRSCSGCSQSRTCGSPACSTG